MRQSLQIGIVIVVLIATVGGVAFIRNWVITPEKGPTVTGPDTPGSGFEFTFPTTVVEQAPEVEIRASGHHDFRFQNPNDEAGELGLNAKSCKCSSVQALVLNPDEEQKINSMSPTELQQFLDRSDRWLSLEDDGSGAGAKLAPVPPKRTGFVRLKWEAKQLGPERLKATVWAQLEGKPKTRGPETVLEMPLVVVSPVRLSAVKLEIPELRAGQAHSADLLCYSTTRPQFKITSVKEKSNDPCFVFDVTRLEEAEIKGLAESLKEPPERLLCVYRIRVQVHERAPDGKKQLDLGPFQRELVVTSDQDDLNEHAISVEGKVRGDILVGNTEFPDLIVLKTFPRNKGTEVLVPVETLPGMKLELDSVSPDYVQVQLLPRDGSSNRWNLKVTVPPNRAMSKFGDESAVILKTDNDRRIRIPIMGRATQALGTK